MTSRSSTKAGSEFGGQYPLQAGLDSWWSFLIAIKEAIVSTVNQWCHVHPLATNTTTPSTLNEVEKSKSPCTHKQKKSHRHRAMAKAWLQQRTRLSTGTPARKVANQNLPDAWQSWLLRIRMRSSRASAGTQSPEKGRRRHQEGPVNAFIRDSRRIKPKENRTMNI